MYNKYSGPGSRILVKNAFNFVNMFLQVKYEKQLSTFSEQFMLQRWGQRNRNRDSERDTRMGIGIQIGNEPLFLILSWMFQNGEFGSFVSSECGRQEQPSSTDLTRMFQNGETGLLVSSECGRQEQPGSADYDVDVSGW